MHLQTALAACPSRPCLHLLVIPSVSGDVFIIDQSRPVLYTCVNMSLKCVSSDHLPTCMHHEIVCSTLIPEQKHANLKYSTSGVINNLLNLWILVQTQFTKSGTSDIVICTSPLTSSFQTSGSLSVYLCSLHVNKSTQGGGAGEKVGHFNLVRAALSNTTEKIRARQRCSS